MKKYILPLLLLPLLTMAQKTYVPDNVFENYLENNNMGDGIVGNDSVLTTNIKYQTLLDVTSKNIHDFTGIADFDSLEILWARWTSVDTVDLSHNTALEQFDLGSSGLQYLMLGNHPNLEVIGIDINPISSIDLSLYPKLRYFRGDATSISNLNFSNNPLMEKIYANDCNLNNINLNGCTKLEILDVDNNQLNFLNIEDSDSLVHLFAFNNNISHLDVSHCSKLTRIRAEGNQLTHLNLQNGNNHNMITIAFYDNPSLTCVNVDDVAYADANWSGQSPQIFFSTTCAPYAIDEENTNTNKQLLKIIDVLGRETQPKKNTPLLYIYDDGSVEQKIIF